MPLDMPRRRGVSQQFAIRRDNVQFDAWIEGHQPVKERFQRVAVNPALRIQNRFPLDNLLRQATGQPLHHRITVLRGAVKLHRAGDGRTKRQQQNKQQRQALAQAKAAHRLAPQICSLCPRRCE